MSAHQKERRGASVPQNAPQSLEAPASSPSKSFTLVSLLVILLAAAFLRLYRLDEVPPGLYHDEAFNGLDAWRVLGGEFPVFFEANNGRQPLFIYLQAPSVALLGNTAFALRLTSAVVGLATVLSLYFLAKELRPQGVRWPHFALLAPLLLAVLYWHVNFSRVGFRPILFPLVVSWLLYFYWRGVRGKGYPHYLLAGFFLAAAFYTYTAAYLLPLVLLLMTVYLWWRQRERSRQHLFGLALVGGMALLLSLPLAHYFWGRPHLLFGRAADVSILHPTSEQGTPVVALAENVGRAAVMFFLAGDENWRHNIAGRPLLDPLAAALFAVGLLLYAKGYRDPAKAFMLILALVMLTPTILSNDGIPHASRVYGMVPAVALMASYGLLRLWAALDRWWPWRRGGPGLLHPLPAAGMMLLVGGSIGLHTFVSYFFVWAPHPQTYEFFDSDRADAARFLAQQPALAAAAPVIYISERYEDLKTIYAYLAPGAMQKTVWFDGSTHLLQRPDPQALYVLPRSLAPDPPVMATLAPQAMAVAANPGDSPSERAFFIFQGLRIEPGARSFARVGDLLEVTGASVPPEAVQGGTLRVWLHWRPLTAAMPGQRSFLHLLDARGRIWAQSHQDLPSISAMGPVGTEALTWHPLAIDPTTPPGQYSVVLGVLTTHGDLPIRDGQGVGLGQRFGLGSVAVRRSPTPPGLPLAQIQHPTRRSWDEAVELLGYRLSGSQVSPGESLRLDLFWRSLRPTERDYGVSVALRAPGGSPWWWQRERPVDGGYPTPGWSPGEIVREVIDIPVPAQAPPGLTELVVNLTDLQVPEPPAAVSALTRLEVLARQRLFSLPKAPETLHAASFGDVADLLGYDLKGLPRTGTSPALDARSSAEVRLYWRARRETGLSYKVSLQLLSPDKVVVAQHDAPPEAGRNPTTAWAAGEIVADEHQVGLPSPLRPGRYSLILVLYEERSGERLPVDGRGDHLELAAFEVK